MSEYPHHLLTPEQAQSVAALLREHPQGKVESRDGHPVFVSETANEVFTVDLVSQKLTFAKKR